MAGRILKLKPSRNLLPDAKTAKVLDWWAQLEDIHRGFTVAAMNLAQARMAPVCVPNCGKCCHVSVMSRGIEAELARSYMLGQPNRIKPVLDRCREWLTRKGEYTYGSGINEKNEEQVEFERRRIMAEETCPFLIENELTLTFNDGSIEKLPDLSCLVHNARPLACRAYSVTHLPDSWCQRPFGIGEKEGLRGYWPESTPQLPLRPKWDRLLGQIDEPRFNRQGFFAFMLFEALATTELAGLMDDGKIPLAKGTVGWGGDYTLLWQDQVNKVWKAQAADKDIIDEPPLQERDGTMVQVSELG